MRRLIERVMWRLGWVRKQRLLDMERSAMEWRAKATELERGLEEMQVGYNAVDKLLQEKYDQLEKVWQIVRVY